MEATKKLSAVLATEKGLRQRVNKQFSALYALAQKNDLFDGHTRTFTPVATDGDDDKFKAGVKEERRSVQHNYKDVLQQSRYLLTDLYDFLATRDWSNLEARADIVVDGEVFIAQAPVTFLLSLDKQLSDYIDFISKMVEMDPSVDWLPDDGTGEFRRSQTTRVQSTTKDQRPIVLYHATPEHPAQTQLITKDVVIGHWDTVRFSGAIPRPVKMKILERLQKLKDACLRARAVANTTGASEQRVGDKIFEYLLDTAK